MPTIDNKIVQMTFDNQQFERGVAESLKSLEALKKGLELDKAVDSLSNLERTANSFDISGIAKGVDQVADKFTFLGKVAQNVYDDIYRAGKQAISGMINTITEMPRVGEQKYETKNKAVQMIMSAMPEKSLQEVEDVLARLNEYTDLTSYDFATMAKSIGKFTAAGVDLDIAERAMEGIANVTASAGGEISQANIAMYNFSQALSTGSVRLMDWRSIENQNLATKEFKEQIIETAYELGVLGKVQDKVGKTAKGTVVTYENFSQTLSEGWFNSDVLISVLEKYADTTTDVGAKAFKAAREAITLQQAIDAIKDALSTGWMTSWQFLIGNLDEATENLTKASDAVIDFLAQFSDYRNDVLRGWHDGVTLVDDKDAEVISGYALAVETLGYAWDIVTGFVNSAVEAFAQVFGLMDARGLVGITKQIHDAVKDAHDIFGAYEETVRSTVKVEEEAVSATRDWSGELAKGANNSQSEVKKMQELFIQLNKDTDTFGDKFKDVVLTNFGADGLFGTETEEAVKAFQRALGDVDVTGVFDKATQEKLDELITPELKPAAVREWGEELKRGAKNADVKSMQRLFMQLNSDTDRFGDKFKNVVLTNFGADGIFGKETENAVKEFQKAMGLEVTGIFDKKTQEKLDEVFYPEGKKETKYQTIEDTLYRINPGLIKFQSIVRGVLSIVRVGVNLGKAALSIVGSVVKAVMPVVNGIFSLAAGLGDVISVGLDFISMFDLAGMAASAFDFLISPIAGVLQTVGDSLSFVGDFLSFVAAGFESLMGLLGQGKTFEQIGEELALDPEANAGALLVYNTLVMLQGVAESLKPYFEELKNSVTSFFKTAYEYLSGKFSAAWKSVTTFFSNLWTKIKEGKVAEKILGTLVLVLKGLLGVVTAVGYGIFALGSAIVNGVKWLWNLIVNSETFANVLERIKTFTAPITTFFSSLFDSIGKIVSNPKEYLNFEQIWSNLINSLAKSKIGVKFIRPLLKLQSKIKGISKSVGNFSKQFSIVFYAIKRGDTLDKILGELSKDPEKNRTAIGLVNFLLKLRNLFESIKTSAGKVKLSISSFFSNTWKSLKEFGSQVWNGIVDFFAPEDGPDFIERTKQKIEEIWSSITETWDTIKVKFRTYIETNETFLTVRSWAESAWASVVEWLVPGEDGKGLIQHVGDGISTISTEIEQAKNTIDNFFEDLKNNEIVSTVSGWAVNAWNSIIEWLLPGTDGMSVVDNIHQGIERIKDKIREIWDGVSSFFGEIVGYFRDKIAYLEKEIPQILFDLRETIENKIEELKSNPIVSAAITWAESAWASVIEWFLPGADGQSVISHIRYGISILKRRIFKIRQEVVRWWDSIKSTPIISAVVDWTTSAWAGIVEFFTPKVGEEEIGVYISHRLTEIKNAISEAWNEVVAWFQGVREEYPIIDEAAGWIESAWGRIVELINRVHDKIVELNTINPETNKTPIQEFFDNAGSIFDPIVNFFNGVGDDLSGGWESIRTAFDNVSNKFGVFGWVRGILESLGSSFENFNLENFLDNANGIMTAGLIGFGLTKLAGLAGGWSNIFANIISGVSGGKFKFGLNQNNILTNISNVFHNIGTTFMEAGIGAILIAASVEIVVDAFNKLYKIVETADEEKINKCIEIITQIYWAIGGITGGKGIITGLTTVLESVFTKQSTKKANKIDVSGPLAIAGAIWIIVDAFNRMWEILKDVDNLSGLGKINKVIDIISRLVGIFVKQDYSRTMIEGTTSLIGRLTERGIFGSSNFSLNQWGALSSGAGAVGIAYALKIIVGVIQDLANIIKEFEPVGKMGEGFASTSFEDVSVNLENILSQIEGLILVLNGSEAVVGYFTKNAWGQISSGGGAIATAVALEIIIDAINRLAEVNRTYAREGSGFADIVGVIAQIASLIAVLNSSEAVIGAATKNGFGALGIFASAINNAVVGFTTSGIINSLGNALAKIQQSGITTEKINAFAAFINTLVGLLKGADTLQNILSGITKGFSAIGSAGSALSMWAAGDAIGELVGALADAVATIKDVPSDTIDSFAAFVNTLYGLFNGFNLINGLTLGLPQLLGGMTLEGMIDHMTKLAGSFLILGPELDAFASSTSEINDWSVFDQAAGALKTMVSTLNGITNYEGAAQVLDRLGGSIALYSKNIAGLTIDDNNHIDATTLQEVFDTLQEVFDSEGAMSVINSLAPREGSTVSEFAAGVTNLGTALATYGTEIGNLDSEKIGLANDTLKTISELKIPGDGGFLGWLLGKQGTFDEFAYNIGLLGGGLKTFDTELGPNFDPSGTRIAGAVGIIGQLVGYAMDLDALKSSYSNFDTLRDSFLGFFTGLETVLAGSGNWTDANLVDYARAATELFTAIATGMNQNVDILIAGLEDSLSIASGSINSEETNSWWNDVGWNIDRGIAQGITDGAYRPKLAAYALALSVWRVVKDFFGIASPSKQFAWIGQMSDEGLAQGLTQYSNVVESASEDVADAALNGYENRLLESINDAPVIRPVLDLSDVTSGLSTMDGLFGNYDVGVTSSGMASSIANGGRVNNGSNGSGALAGAVDALNDRVDQLGYAISHMQVVTETGAIIGAIRTGMDLALGEEEYYNSRGI